MGHSVIPEPSDEQRPQERVVDDDEAFMEPKPVVLSGQEAVDFAEMVLSRPPKPSPAFKKIAKLYRKMVVSE